MFNTVRKYRQCKITISDEDTVLIKNLYQFGECCSRRIETEFFGEKVEKEKTTHFTGKDSGNRKHRPQSRER